MLRAWKNLLDINHRISFLHFLFFFRWFFSFNDSLVSSVTKQSKVCRFFSLLRAEQIAPDSGTRSVSNGLWMARGGVRGGFTLLFVESQRKITLLFLPPAVPARLFNEYTRCTRFIVATIVPHPTVKWKYQHLNKKDGPRLFIFTRSNGYRIDGGVESRNDQAKWPIQGLD